jgi:predicted GH43/DUF377 family glycosyl hydrolase
VETVHNAAVVKHEGEYIMFFLSHLRAGRSIIGRARSPDGFRFTANPQPFLVPERDSPFAGYEEFGVEDTRVIRLEGEYVITYSAYSRNGVRIALAKTKDFSQVGMAFHLPRSFSNHGWIGLSSAGSFLAESILSAWGQDPNTVLAYRKEEKRAQNGPNY